MTRLLAIGCLLTLAVRGDADERPAAWSEGANRFQIAREQIEAGKPSRAHFRRAAEILADAVQSDHPESFLNLGNAHYLAGNLPEAIAAYDAGLTIDPFDRRLRENLAVARRDVTLPADSKLARPGTAWQRYLFQPGIDVVAAFAVMVAAIALPVSLRVHRRRGVIAGIAAAAVAAMAGLSILICADFLDDVERRPVYVVRSDTPLRTGNAESYPSHSDAPLLPRGFEVRRLGKRGNWLHIECPGGPIGWIPKASVIAY